ncbi:MAG: hypothetical protein M1826_004399 [Phylliscum demangeonii]|nr:MAG: hypothetical protein M1826_004399 [Phylliscum demangeonii]
MTGSPPAERPQAWPRTRSRLSFSSNKSAKSLASSPSVRKADLRETTAEKSRNRLQSKADPSLAIHEVEPSIAATTQKSNLESLRAIQHRDTKGNIIADPDRSNPTRSRWERPLDTIRSFEAAIDDASARRQSRVVGVYLLLAPSDIVSAQANARVASSAEVPGRRSSYHQAPHHYHQNSYASRVATDLGYYANRTGGSRVGNPTDHNAGPYQHPPSRPRFGGRIATETPPPPPPPPHHGGSYPGHAVYPSPAYQRSYDTVTSASGTGSNNTETWNTSTDPSSENSSIERGMPQPPPAPAKPDLAEVYGLTTFGTHPDLPPPSLAGYHAPSAPSGRMPGAPGASPSGDGGYGGYGLPSAASGLGPGVTSAPMNADYPSPAGPGPPPVPRHYAPPAAATASGRAPIKLGGSPDGPPTSLPRTTSVEKKKGWFKRFSRG